MSHEVLGSPPEDASRCGNVLESPCFATIFETSFAPSKSMCLAIKVKRACRAESCQGIDRCKEFQECAYDRCKIIYADGIGARDIVCIARRRISDIMMMLIDELHSDFPLLDCLSSRSIASRMSDIIFRGQTISPHAQSFRRHRRQLAKCDE